MAYDVSMANGLLGSYLVLLGSYLVLLGSYLVFVWSKQFNVTHFLWSYDRTIIVIGREISKQTKHLGL